MNQQLPVIISADSHVLEPGDLWTKGAPGNLLDVLPRIESTEKGDVFVFENQKPWLLGVEFAAGEGDKQKARGRSWNARPTGGYIPADRIAAQEIDGVWAEIMYPTLGLYLYRIKDAKLQERSFDAYNNWLGEFCSSYPDRLIGIGMVSAGDVDAACRQVRRVADLGLSGVMLPSVMQPEYNSPEYEPLWAIAEELNLPISFHVGTGEQLLQYRGRGAGGMNVWRSITNVFQPFVFMMWSGVFERFPKLRIGFIEGGISWIPSSLDILDTLYDQHKWIEHDLTRKPSEYWKSNCFATFERSLVGLKMREIPGSETLLWASDYPHAESTWPNSRATIEADMKGLSAAEIELITLKNVQRIYNLPDKSTR